MLLGLSDANYQFIYIDARYKRRIIDGGVFQNASVSKSREKISLNIAEARLFPGGHETLPFAIVADDTF